MSKPAAFIVVENGQTWLRTSAETEEAIRTGFIMETVPLYTAPPTHLISAAPELLEALENWINALDNPSEWMKCRDDAKKAIAKAHGIGGE
jgi:hypothetical protein